MATVSQNEGSQHQGQQHQEPQHRDSRDQASRIQIHHGARATEDAVLEAIEISLTRATWQDLGTPIRVIVPSSTLRAHLAARLVERRKKASLGVMVQTLHGLASEILQQRGEAAPKGQHLFNCLVERMARDEPELSKSLEGFVDGYQTVGATVRDLLDAGLEPALQSAAEEILDSEGPGRAPRETLRRSTALVRVATNTQQAMDILELGRSAQLLRRAQRILEEDPPAALPARQILIHGFADATGIATDFLESLLRFRPASVFFDLPPDPGAFAVSAGEEADPGEGHLPDSPRQRLEAEFPKPLLDRLSAAAGTGTGPGSETGAGSETEAGAGENDQEVQHHPAVEVPSYQLELVEATGPEEEVDAVAQAILRGLADGLAPESFGVVTRDLSRYQHLLWRRFQRLGIPFATSDNRSQGSLLPQARVGRALLHLLQWNERTPIDRWLEILSLPAPNPGQRDRLRMELRLALHSLGAGRVFQAAELDPETSLHRDSLVLPVLQGLEESEAGNRAAPGDGDGEAEASLRPTRRALPGEDLRWICRRAQELQEHLLAWPREAPLEEHLDLLDTLLLEHLSWPEENAHRDILRMLREARRQFPQQLPVSRGELHRILAAMFEEKELAPLGGQGAGVRVLSVTAARGLTFDRLFLLGLNRDSFPRPIREDPLLSDDLRKLLSAVLPDIPIKGRGHSEERYLFAQLLTSSPHITLGWSEGDAEGRPIGPSPLLERLRWSQGKGLEERRVGALFTHPHGKGPVPQRPTEDLAILEGLFGDRDQFRPLAALTFEEHRQQLGLNNETSGSHRGETLLSVLDELDPDLRSKPGREASRRLGPFSGLVGPTAPKDPRRKALFVTQLEALAACPWQAFLQRVLRLQPTPDPLQALPEISPLLVGQLVHAAIDCIVGSTEERKVKSGPTRGEGALGTQPTARLEIVLEQPPRRPTWPEPEELQGILTTLARQVLADEGIHFPGFARPLVERARPYLESAWEELWEGASQGPPIHGSEVRGEVRLQRNDLAESQQQGQRYPGRVISFRADLVEAVDNGIRLTDLKTGKPIDSSKTPAARKRHFLKAVSRGEKLQAVAYLLAAEEVTTSAEQDGSAMGRYLFLRPDLDPGLRDFSAASKDEELKAAFYDASFKVLEAWDQGIFFPRLVDPRGEKEPLRCSHCAVAEACTRGDSGSRRRLVTAADTLAEKLQAGETLSALEAAFIDTWQLAE